ncbi:MAG: hypothetical protein EOR67_27825 [Mesorhizobium sp.]|uniref:hypothetical protein n=1 Tax=Mesorhizobium sp. TaxID=1871066 RepID=UPI000FE5121D|nr:hypothetical protein [Mesorhizobium sp.]RWL82404.1 MAG: hypothetical protein EOR67_27825 [Mesorhizobium sp.]
MDGMVEGTTLLKRRVESRIQTGEAKLKEDYEEKLRALEKDFEARVEAAMLERLELLTRPNPEPDGILASF